MTFSFVIPVLNAERHLRRCLSSIRAQVYPAESIEIIVLDGGSTDATIAIAAEYDCRVLANPKRLAEYGVQLGVANSMAELVVVFAADNELESRHWASTAATAFKEERIYAAWGPLRSGCDDPPVNRYFELIQSDPMTHFMNRNLYRYLSDNRTEYRCGRFVFSVDPARPLPWGANGLVYRREAVSAVWAQPGYLGDNDAFQQMVEEGRGRVAYIPSLVTYHHHVGEVGDWVRKWKRNFSLHFLDNIETRNTNWVFAGRFRLKLLLWLLYSTNPVVSGVHSAYLCARDRNPFWAYHPLLCLLQTSVYAYLSIATPKGRKVISRVARGTLKEALR